MPITKVALMGTRGRLAPFILSALVNTGKFDVSVLVRAESSATLPAEFEGKVKTITLPPDFVGDENGVGKVLVGLDAVVMAIPGDRNREQMAIMNGCVKAGVGRFIPADYGSVDSNDSLALDMVPLYGSKKHLRQMLQGMGMMYHQFTWTSLVPAHFFDYGIDTPLLGFDIHSDPPSATIFDSGDLKWSASTRARIGEAVVAVLLNPEQTENKMLYIQSFRTSQNELLQILEKVSGKKFTVKKVESEAYMKQKKQEMDSGNEEAVEEMVCVLGLTRSDWEGKPDLANELLGLKEQSVEEEVKKAWEARTVPQ